MQLTQILFPVQTVSESDYIFCESEYFLNPQILAVV